MGFSERKSVLSALALAIVLLSVFMLSVTAPFMMGLPASGSIRVACVGDSITEGTEYPLDLQTLLGENYTVRNFGAGGSTVLFSSDKPYIYRPAFQRALDFHPDMVIIMLGTNDGTPKYFNKIDNFVSEYKMIISHFEIYTKKIWLVIPPPIFNDSIGPSENNLVQKVIPGIQQVAQDMNLTLINVYTPLLNYPEHFWDGVHPDYFNARIIANEVYRGITNGTTAPMS